MLILIAGITGNIGQHSARHALALGHAVRGLGRSPNKLDPIIKSQLESFITSKSYDDISALDAACKGADAVICAYSGLPELHLDGQLLLLRAAERAGIKRFLTACFNNDWRKVPWAVMPIYDPARAFHMQAALSSTVKPLHILSGTFMDVFFGGEGQGKFGPEQGGWWDAEKRSIDVWGTGEEVICLSSEEDCGRWGVELVTGPRAVEGGFVGRFGWRGSVREVKEVYERVRGVEVAEVQRGKIEDLEREADEGEKRWGVADGGLWKWFPRRFTALCLRRTWDVDENGVEDVAFSEKTGLEEWLKKHPEVG